METQVRLIVLLLPTHCFPIVAEFECRRSEPRGWIKACMGEAFRDVRRWDPLREMKVVLEG